MVLQILADTRNVMHRLDPDSRQLVRRTDCALTATDNGQSEIKMRYR
jgi:hypothetical protein